jgi:hypothetical protein
MSNVSRAAVKVVKIDQGHDAPVISVDGAHGLVFTGNQVKLNLVQDRLNSLIDNNPDDLISRVVCARLVMSREAFEKILNWLNENASQLLKMEEDKPDERG